jgi:hypothetical protein
MVMSMPRIWNGRNKSKHFSFVKNENCYRYNNFCGR